VLEVRLEGQRGSASQAGHENIELLAKKLVICSDAETAEPSSDAPVNRERY